MPVPEHTLTLDGSPVFYRGAPAPPVTPVYLHTAPTSSDDWSPLLERTGGVAPDLVGFGRSGKGGHLDYTPQGIADVVGALLDKLGLQHVALAGHGWGGAVAVALAGAQPERVTRLVLVDPAPPLAEVEWFRLARWWRRPVVGELVMGSINRWMLARHLRGSCARPDAWPDDRVAAVWEQFDQGTQRATLRLYRWPDESARAGLASTWRSLAMPRSILWGALDPWLPPAQAGAWGDAIELIEDAGHWPWLDRPDVVDRLADLMAAA